MAVIDNLKVSKEAMQTAITNFEARKNAMENAYLKISNEVRTLDNTWHGAASEKFKSQFDALYRNLQQNTTAMTNIIDKLKSAVQVYEESEQQAKQLVESMDIGKAFDMMPIRM